MDADGKKKQVSYAQLNALIEFLKEHQELAKGLNRGRRAKLQTLKTWHLCAKTLNTYKDGAFKDAKGWSKYWCDWKYRVRRRALELKAAKNNNKPPPDGLLPLSSMEETILSVIGENAVEGVVIKSDPLGNGDSDEDFQDNTDHHEDLSLNRDDDAEISSPNEKRRRSDNLSDIGDTAGPSSPLRTKHNEITNNAHLNNTDVDDEATEFLKLEREKLDISQQMADSLHTIRSDITRLVDIMGHIRDIIANNRIHL